MKHSRGAVSCSAEHTTCESDERTVKSPIQQLRNIVILSILLVFRWTKEIACTEHQVELPMLRINRLDFGEEVPYGADRWADCKSVNENESRYTYTNGWALTS